MRKRKPRAYIQKYIVGYFGVNYHYRWIAKDYWGNQVASGVTRKDCETDCRAHGYVPERA